MIPDIAAKIALDYLPKKAPVRIGLLGMYSSANLGDTAIQEVVIAALRSRRPSVEFIGLCPHPEDTARTHGIPGFPISGNGLLALPQGNPVVETKSKLPANNVVSSLLRIPRALHNIERQVRVLDMLIISGGGQIDDYWGGPWEQPFRLFIWCLFARLHRKPIVAFSLGMDNLNSRLSKWFSVLALQMAQHRSFRDRGSLDALQNLGLNSSSSMCPDPAFALSAISPAGIENADRKKPKFVVISPISRSAFPGTSKAEHDEFLRKLAAAVEAFQHQGLGVRFVCSQRKMDTPVALQVIAQLKTNAGVSLANVRTVDDFLLAVSGAELVIASRLHALIFAMVAGTPIIAVSPARKVNQLMIDIGLEDFCLELNSLKVPILLARAQAILARRREMKKHVMLHVSEYRKQIENAFEQLAMTVPSSE